jgi:hypothetical protein
MPASSSSSSSAAAAITTTITTTTNAPNNNDKTNNNNKDTSSVKLPQRCIGTIAKVPPRRSAAVTERELVRLRALRHSHASSVERQARIVALAVRELVELHERMDRKGRAIAGDDYEVRHTILFERHGSAREPRRGAHPLPHRRRRHGPGHGR